MEFPHAYYWELLFDNGVIISQLDQYTLPKSIKVEPNTIGFNLGIPVQIKLLETKTKTSVITVEIPPGYTPVYFMPSVIHASGFVSRLGFSVGWKSDTSRTIFNLDPTTGMQTLRYEGK